MKLLFVLDIDLDSPGPSVHLLKDILNALAERNFFVDIIMKKSNDRLDTKRCEEEIPANFSYQHIKGPGKKRNIFIIRYLEEIKYALKCRKIYRKKKYDAVFLQSCNTAIFHVLGLRRLKCPIIFNVQDIFPYNLKFSNQLPYCRILFPILRKLQNMAYNRVNRIITISDDMRNTLVLDGVDSKKIDVIYNWSYSDDTISIEKIDSSCIFELNSIKKDFKVVYAGNIGRMQNVEIIASAAETMVEDKRIHFYIVGDGANRKTIYERVKSLSNVTMLPMQPSKFAESIYAQADINIIPLMPGVVFTALPSKTATCLRVDKPVIFCVDRDSDFFELVNNELGIAIDANDVSGLVKSIYELYEDKSQKALKGFSTLFSKDNASKYVDIIEKTTYI